MTAAARTCLHCGRSMSRIVDRRARYCSHSCRSADHRPDGVTYTFVCDNPECGKTFETRYSRYRYCSARCGARMLRPKQRVAQPASNPLAWVILEELPDRGDGIEYARCRCARGHVAEIAIDVRPAPPCVQCGDRQP